MKRLKRILVLSTLAVLCIVLALLGTSYYYKDEIIAKVMTELEQHITTPVKVQSVDFSLIQNFPNASIVFDEVWIADALAPEDTLLFAKELSLAFDVVDLINEEYTIDRATIEGGSLNMRTLADGAVNYVFWKTIESDTSSTNLAIDQLSLKDIRFNYVDEPVDLVLFSHVDKAQMKGLFSQDWMDMNIQLHGEKTDILIDGAHYLQDNEIAFTGGLKVDKDATDFHFADCLVEIGDVAVPLGGRVSQQDDGWMVDLDLQGDLELTDFLSELPADQKGSLDSYQLHGDVAFDMQIHGLSDKHRHPQVDLDFDLTKGQMQLQGAQTRLKELKALGHYTRDTHGVDAVSFEQFSASLPSGEMSYRGSIRDFDHPYVDGRFSCEADFRDMVGFAERPRLTKCSGQLQAEMTLKGKLPIDGADVRAWKALNPSGTVELKDIAGEIVSSGYSIAQAKGTGRFHNGDMGFQELSFELNGSQFRGDMNFSGLLAYALTDGAVLSLDGTLSADAIDWSWWSENVPEGGAEPIELPSDIALRLTFDVDEFNAGAFSAEGLSAQLRLRDRTLSASSIVMTTCKGRLEGSLKASQAADLSWVFSTELDIDDMDIRSLFTEFNQFGQEFLLDKHIGGRGDAEVYVKAELNPQLEVNQERLLVDADIALHDGELIGHPAMVDIIEAIRERQLLQSFVRADELEEEVRHIRFETLANSIRIRDGRIMIPEMRIVSSAMEIGISGAHGFDDKIDYHLDFSLRDILVNKSNPEFYIEDDGLGHVIHLRMQGTVDDPLISLDKEKTKENRKEALAEAKEDIKDFFSSPFKSKEPKEDRDERTAVKVELVGASNTDTSNKEKDSEESPKKKRWFHVEEAEEVDFGEEEEDDF